MFFNQTYYLKYFFSETTKIIIDFNGQNKNKIIHRLDAMSFYFFFTDLKNIGYLKFTYISITECFPLPVLFFSQFILNFKIQILKFFD